jgi:hypothetical protein
VVATIAQWCYIPQKGLAVERDGVGGAKVYLPGMSWASADMEHKEAGPAGRNGVKGKPNLNFMRNLLALY